MRPFRAHILTIVALLAGIVATRNAGRVVYDQEPGVRLDLPGQAGPWHGESVLFCQKPSCGRDYLMSALKGATNCSVCGSALGTKAPPEAKLLPPDTYVRHMSYNARDHLPMGVILVLAGTHRTSIHRPELCFAGSVAHSELMKFELPGRGPLNVRVLTLRSGPAGSGSYSFFAYWFVAKGRETASHNQRILWMAADRLFRGIDRRWAYVSVTGDMTPGSESHLDELRAFLRDFVPQLAPH